MRIRISSTILAGLLLSVTNNMVLFCEARKSGSRNGGHNMPSRRSTGSKSRSGSGMKSSRSSSSTRVSPSSSSRRREPVVEDEYDEQDTIDDEEEEYEESGLESDDQYDEDDENNYDEYDDFERERKRPSSRLSSRRRDYPPPSKSTSRSSKSSLSSSSRQGGRSSRSSGHRSSSRRSRGRVVPYTNHPRTPTAFSRGISALVESIPDANTIKDTAISSISTARQTTSRLSSNLYRDIKGLTSSELEQVMLKATKPDDSPVKGKHVERLVGVTYQISGRYDIYDAVLRKLWSKMTEKDWRTTIKALYVLHRFSVDGAPDHQAALKARLRELRRNRDKKKVKFFNSKTLLAGDSTPETISFRAFLARYAHYVLLRVQCFGGIFSEIAKDSTSSPSSSNSKKSSSKSSPSASSPKKAITSTRLKNEHLEASKLLLKAGLACKLKPSEECENTAIAMERVVSDLIGLTTAVASALNFVLKNYDDDLKVDKSLIKEWCEFYSQELFPQTKAMMKSSTPTLDAFGLFLPSRMGTSVNQDLLQKGLKHIAMETDEEETTLGNVQEKGEDEKVEEKDRDVDKDDEEVEEEEEGDEVDEEGDEDVDGEEDVEDEDTIEDDHIDEESDEYEYDDEYYDEEF